MNEVQIIEDRLFAQEYELLEKLLADPSDSIHDLAVAASGDVLIAITDVLRGNLAAVIDKLAAAAVQIQSLEAKFSALESREMKFEGRHDKTRRYDKGSVVNYGGSAWIATNDALVGEMPNASASWTVLVKRGRDASHRSGSRNDLS